MATLSKGLFLQTRYGTTRSRIVECTQVVIVVVSGMFLSVSTDDLRELAKVTIMQEPNRKLLVEIERRVKE